MPVDSPMWIRSARWDGVWVFAGVPLAVALLTLSRRQPTLPLALWLTALLSVGHALSPIVLAWGQPEYRRTLRRRLGPAVFLPFGIVCACAALGLVSARFFPGTRPLLGTAIDIADVPGDMHNPFVLVAIIYVLWNGFHFGMQSFGVMSLYRRNAGIAAAAVRRRDLVYCCTTTWATLAIPFMPVLAHGLNLVAGWPPAPHPFLNDVRLVCTGGAVAAWIAMTFTEVHLPTRLPGLGVSWPRVLYIAVQGFSVVSAFWFGLWGFAIVSVPHWLVAIGLASRVATNGRRAGVMATFLIALGVAVFVLMFVSLSTWSLRVTLPALGCRIGLGFVHFLYDRRVWRLREPVVRAVLARSLPFA